MRRLLSIALGVVVSAPCGASADTPRAALLRVLYVGDKETDRARAYAAFLDEAFILSNVVDRRTFDPASVVNVDVVILDWPQDDLAESRGGNASPWEREVRSPLGDRRAWRVPTVLLGTAGHQLALAWKTIGANGCPCFNPAAYDLHDHPIFNRPIAIERGKLTRRPWPQEWTEWHDEAEIRVLPLTQAKKQPRQPGWCAYPRDMEEAPEVEVFCGGVNAKDSDAIAVWRQGNLLHFGFDASPAEFNSMGKALLVNAIAYISRFTEDQPIVEIESPGRNPVLLRTTIVKMIARNSSEAWQYLKASFDPGVLAAAGIKTLPAFAGWYASVREFAVPSAEGLMTVDADALALYIKPSRAEFFPRAIATLARPGEDAAKARRLLARYAPPDCPGPAATVQQWSAWRKANRDYLFFSEIGGYRWYVDPLAKARKVPTDKLRGEKRASH
jgi:hypothetical protein